MGQRKAVTKMKALAYRGADRAGKTGRKAKPLASALLEALQGFPQRAAFKHALHLCGMPETRVRPPEGELTPEQKARLTARLCG